MTYGSRLQLSLNPFLIDNAPNLLDLPILELIKHVFAETDASAIRVPVPQISIDRGDIVELNADCQYVVLGYHHGGDEVEIWDLGLMKSDKVLIAFTRKELVIMNDVLLYKGGQRWHRRAVERSNVVEIDGFEIVGWRGHLEINEGCFLKLDSAMFATV